MLFLCLYDTSECKSFNRAQQSYYLLILFGIAKYTDNGCVFFSYHSPQNTTPSVPYDYIVRNSSDIQTISLRWPFSRNHLSIWNQCYIHLSTYWMQCNLYASRITQLSIFKVVSYIMSLLLCLCYLEFHYLDFQKIFKKIHIWIKILQRLNATVMLQHYLPLL